MAYQLTDAEKLEQFNKMVNDYQDQDLDRIDQLDSIKTSDIRPKLKAGDRIGVGHSAHDNRIGFGAQALIKRALDTDRYNALDKIFTYLQVPEHLTFKERLAWFQLLGVTDVE